ncbi:MAG: Outer membrane efflux protein [bacterium ADurb.Bin374]|nr:MAG: Outer membrane efflux protein [bacterium ADurb.Bin374]
MQLSVPVLDGKLTRYSIEEQRNGVEQARASLDQQRLAVRAEIETAVTGVRDAFQRLSASEILLKQAAESLSLAEGRFDAGLGSPIEITDARAAYSSARGSHITAYYDSLIALTTLDRALGIMPAETGGMSAWTAGAVTDETILEADIASVTPIVTHPASETTGIDPVASDSPVIAPGNEPAPIPDNSPAASPETDDAESNE